MVTIKAIVKATQTAFSSLSDAAKEVAQNASAAYHAQKASDEAAAQAKANAKRAAEMERKRAELAAYDAEQRAKAAAEKAARIATLEAQISGWKENIARMHDEIDRASRYQSMLCEKMNEIRAKGEKVKDSLFETYLKACDERSALHHALMSAYDRIDALGKELDSL